MKWELSGRWREPQVFDDPDELAEHITNDSDYISEMEPDEDSVFDYDGKVDVFGVDYWPSQILREIDRDRYDEMMDNEKEYLAESNREEISRELEMMSYGEETEYQGGIKVRCVQDDDGDEDDESEVEENEDLIEILDFVV